MAENTKTPWAELFSHWGSKLPGLSEEETEEFCAAVKTGSLAKAVGVVKKSDELLKKTQLNIGVIGDTGTGKSSFINAMRSLNDDDNGAAKTGVTETTTEPTPYPHPKHPKVTLWDLPGVGTQKYPKESYLDDIKFDNYNFFIIITAGRFTESDAMIALQIQRREKKFYFVRSKVDVDLFNEGKKRNFNKEKTLQTIRGDCVKKLEDLGVSSPQVFLVSRWDFDKYDSPQLQETFLSELDTHKRHVLLCALPSTCEPILKVKKKALEEQIWKQALKSSAVAAVPVPGLSIACDVDILVASMTEYCKAFGLDDDSLTSLAKQFGKSIDELKSVIQSAMVKNITREEALKRLKEATGVEGMVAKSLLCLIPLIGTIIAAQNSYEVTYAMLQVFLNEVAADAERVLKKALEGAENNQ
nr:interferon-inducible GTPase 5-like [Pelodiscus sinensis]|eukprot:XP_006112709.1 interferon-inducible GTPase 5-like [Pelodiscus sinensis]